VPPTSSPLAYELPAATTTPRRGLRECWSSLPLSIMRASGISFSVRLTSLLQLSSSLPSMQPKDGYHHQLMPLALSDARYARCSLLVSVCIETSIRRRPPPTLDVFSNLAGFSRHIKVNHRFHIIYLVFAKIIHFKTES
jgi:hypothetical protein